PVRIQRGEGIQRRVALRHLDLARDLARLGAARVADRPGRLRRVLQRGETDFIGIGERGLLARNRAHADALLDREAARLDDTLLEAPALGTGVLEIQVGVVESARR